MHKRYGSNTGVENPIDIYLHILLLIVCQKCYMHLHPQLSSIILHLNCSNFIISLLRTQKPLASHSIFCEVKAGNVYSGEKATELVTRREVRKIHTSRVISVKADIFKQNFLSLCVSNINCGWGESSERVLHNLLSGTERAKSLKNMGVEPVPDKKEQNTYFITSVM